MQPPRFKRLKPRPEIEGASPEHYVTNLEETLTSALLQCVVRGAFPKPEVVWTDSDGKILDADEPKVTQREGNKYDTVLRITVTKTDNYTCVATQKEINHQNNRTIFVRFNEETEKSSIVVPVLVTAVVVGGVLLTVGIVIGRRSRSNTGGPTPRKEEEIL